MYPGGMPDSERAYLLTQQSSAVAWGHGQRWAVATASSGEHRAPAGAIDTLDEDGMRRHVEILRLVPMATKSRRQAGNILRGWGTFWLVALGIGAAAWAGDPLTWCSFAAAALVVTMILPGWILALSAPKDARVVLPLEVLRDRVDADGLHDIELRDVDGSTISLTTTRTLATVLLLSSQFDGDVIFTGAAPVLDGSTAADYDRPRDPAEVAAAAAAVNAAYPSELYPPQLIDPQLEQAARVANVSRAQLDARVKQLVEDDESVVAGPSVSATVATVTSSNVSWACGWAGLGWILVAVAATVLTRVVGPLT